MLPSIDDVPLRAGSHSTRDDGMCAMEMVAWLAGEAHGDEPRCACPVIGALVRACNDAMPDGQRNRWLKPLVPLLVGTRATAAVERARGMMVVDTLVRTMLPLRLCQQGRVRAVPALAELPAIERCEQVPAALAAVEQLAPSQRAAAWVLQRVVDGWAPARYVAGAVTAVRATADPRTWRTLVALIHRLVHTGATAPVAAFA